MRTTAVQLRFQLHEQVHKVLQYKVAFPFVKGVSPLAAKLLCILHAC